MELPSRPKKDVLLPRGEMTDIRRRLRVLATKNDLVTVIACAFDHRTRMLPFIYADSRMIPAGVRAIGSGLVDSGFPKTRIVLQQWNRHFAPEEMRLDGRFPDLFLVSSMHLHSSECDRLIKQACAIDPARRPLIIAGGPRMIYEPWHAFSGDPEYGASADVAVTGEEYVLLSLLEVLLTQRAGAEPLRSAFLRARDTGALDGIPGLVYARSSTANGPAEELVDTGIQQLLGDLDELPHPVLGYQLIERPSKGRSLATKPLGDREIRKFSPVSSLVLTAGCKFNCSYCPIPAYNQRQYRAKSGERVADEIQRIYKAYGIFAFFGADDNFFNDTKRTLEICETLARRGGSGERAFRKLRYGTEATVHDTIRIQEHLPVIRESGLFAVWMGVEDLTATLVKKGQSESKTLEAFRLLRSNGIYPIPMMMHHDSQPLVSWKSNYGLVNQLRTLRKAGAIYTQVLMLTPAQGSRWYENTYTDGSAFKSVDGIPVTPRISDGNYVVASKHRRPWVKQMNLLLAYTYFFNPLRALATLVHSKSDIPFADRDWRSAAEVANYSLAKRVRRRIGNKLRARLTDTVFQIGGMVGLLLTFRRTIGWAWHLFSGRIERQLQSPTSHLP
ncbi:MAG TPA: radical SAM protein, partial [Casimicrobiaceae bacterium]